MNMGVNIYFWNSVFILFGETHRSGIAGLCGNSVFGFLRTIHILFHNYCTNLYSYQQCMCSFFLYPCQNIFFCLLDKKCVRCFIIIILICIFVKYIFYVPIGHLYGLLENVYSAPVLIFNYILLLLSCRIFLCILDINPLSYI